MAEIVKNVSITVMPASFISPFQLHATPVYSINSTIKKLNIKKQQLCFSTFMPLTGQEESWGSWGGVLPL